MKLPSASSHNFARVPSAEIPRSSFDRSFGTKTTFDAGYLVPIFVDEVLPGDTFNVRLTAFARLNTPIKPIMDNAYLNTFFFFVPNRLLWSNWEKFNGQQDNPGDSTDFLIPQVEAPTGGFDYGSLADYFGVPVEVDPLSICAFWHRAYNLVFNEWFRDENLQDRVPVPTDDGPDDPADYVLLRRGKRHDYFTSSLPWPQKGESVSIPLGTYATVIPSDPAIASPSPTFTSDGFSGAKWIGNAGATSSMSVLPNGGVSGAADHPLIWNNTGLRADLSDASAATINQLRQAFAVQRLYERDARGGTRYTEVIRAHFGVVSPDARLQRPEYLGGGQTPVIFSAVPQTSESTVNSPQGNLGAYGTVTAHGHGFSKAFTEHGVIIGLMSVRADLNYQQGLPRMFSRQSRFDFYWPALAHIGEQAVLSKEIYCDGTAGDETVWGYQERFAEYRYKNSFVSNQMRSSYPQSLDVWHLAQEFASRPLLNDVFIEDNPPFARVVAVPSEPTFIFDGHFNVRCARPMPVYGVPGLIDHF